MNELPFIVAADGVTAQVPLRNRPGCFATLDLADLKEIRSRGYRGVLCVNSNGRRTQYVRTHGLPGEPTLVQVSRLVTGAGEDGYVRHADGDHLNLTRRNLVVVPRARRRPDPVA